MAAALSRRSPVVRLALAGAAASSGVVVGATGAGPIDGVVTPAGPLGLWSAASTGRGWYAGLAVVSLGALAMLFVQVYRRAAADRLGVRAVGLLAAVWCLPVLPAAPLLSLDVYSYAAQGSMVLAGLDPYVAGPDRLGGPLLQSVAPVWRDTPAPYGPLSLALLARLADLTGGQLVLFVYGLRLVALLGVLGAAVAVVRLAEPQRQPAALALVAANPLVILHLIGGVHLDALVTGLVAGVVLAVRRGHWALAGVAAAVAFAVKVPGVVLIGYVLLSYGRSRRLVGTAVVVAATVLVCAATVPNGWGWLGALDTPGRIHHHHDPAAALSWLIHTGARLVGVPVTVPAALHDARLVAGALGAVTVAVLVWLAARKPSNVRAAARTGGALITVAVAAPTVHPWYATWGLSAVAAGATPRAQWWMVGLSVALCFTALPEPVPHRPAGLALALGLLVAALAMHFAPARRFWLARPVSVEAVR